MQNEQAEWQIQSLCRTDLACFLCGLVMFLCETHFRPSFRIDKNGAQRSARCEQFPLRLPGQFPCFRSNSYPSVQNWSTLQLNYQLTRLGAPRRLLTSRQGRTGAGAGPTADAGVEARRQAEQSSGGRGWRCRWSVVRLAPPREEEDRRGNQSRRQSSATQMRRQTTSRTTNT